jgi:hypothetical protein
MSDNPGPMTDELKRLFEQLDELLRFTLRDNVWAAAALAAAAGFVAGVLLARRRA